MNDVISNVNQLLEGEAGDGLRALGSVTEQLTVALIISLIIGLIVCFFGLKLLSVFVALVGFCFGGVLGGAAALQFNVGGLVLGVIMLIAGVVFALLFCKLYKVGVFLWAFFLGGGAAAVLLKPETLVFMIICLVIGIVFAVLSVIFVEPIVIIGTSVNGGLTAGAAIAGLLGMSQNILISLGSGALLAVLGILVQFMMRSREIGKKEKAYAKEIKKKASMETEVEMARKILDNEKE